LLEDFFNDVINLKKIYRKGWQTKLGIDKPETVADHSYSMATISMIIASLQSLDIKKVLEMSLIHDLAESKIGDLTPEEISQEEKFNQEDQAMKNIFSNLPKNISEDYLKIWTEFKEKTSNESIFVHDMDKFELALQANVYQKEGWSKDKIDPFLETAKNGIKNRYLKEILVKILNKKK